VSCEDLVGGGGSAWKAGGEIEEVFEEDFDGGEAGGGGCCELWGELVDPGTLGIVSWVLWDRGRGAYP
jgi:hypothetical protein